MAETNASGATSKDKLPLGLYLIVETKVPEDVTYTTNPWFVQLPSTDSNGDDWFYDVVCYPKNETGYPTLDKRVRNNPDQANVTTGNADRLADFTSARMSINTRVQLRHPKQRHWIISLSPNFHISRHLQPI